MSKRLLPPDIAFMSETGFSPSQLHRLAAQAEEIGVYAHEHALASGVFSEIVYYRALSRACGFPFAVPWQSNFVFMPLAAEETGAACRVGLIRVKEGGRSFLLSAPYGRDLLRLMERIKEEPELRRHLALTAPSYLREELLRRQTDCLLKNTVEVLRRSRPQDCADRSFHPFFCALTGLIIAVAMSILYRAPVFSHLLGGVCAWLYLLACYCRILAWSDSFFSQPKPVKPLSTKDLPRFSILVPLYRESQVVPQLLQALANLDYPRAKLDILLLVEADDILTRQTLVRARPGSEFRVITMPEGAPRTKPRALQLGLAFARGELLTIYDAEDIPYPQQLRKAAAQFKTGGKKLACLQAELRIDNAQHSWLSRQFALEYAALFNVYLPGLARRGLPILLGGTSNHFRTDILRHIGGWDPWNVTEDADLGVRLARAGYKVAPLMSVTEEEAPVTFRNWFYQRMRWQKGWMQTAAVHFSQPFRLAKDLGWVRAFGLIGTLGVSLLSALAYPLVILWLLLENFFGLTVFGATLWGAGVFGLSLAALIGGHLFPILHIIAGSARAGLKPGLLTLCTVWIYWLMISFAAYGALVGLLRTPHHWSKTDHLGRGGKNTFVPPALLRCSVSESLPPRLRNLPLSPRKRFRVRLI